GGPVSYTVTGLNPSTSYTFEIEATTAAQTSLWSLGSTAITAPNSSSGAVSSGQVKLSWIDNFSDESGFEILQTGPLGTQATLWVDAHPGTGATYYLVSGLDAQSTYTFEV